MISVGVRELKQQASELLRLVREEGRQIQITYRGELVALLVPVERPEAGDQAAAWANLDALAAEIGANWPQGITSVGAVAEGRE